MRRIECVQCGVAISVDCESFAVCGGEPAAEYVGDSRRVQGTGVVEQFERAAWVVQVGQHERLLAGSVDEQGRRVSLPGCDFGGFVVSPGLGEGASVECLPAGGGGGFGQYGGE
ncbi:MAG TPA: hypothetical protein VMU51_38965 [Mycobacteriales bacterium]|nr:hypothetical protein [Mycobacteriales bacterium]